MISLVRSAINLNHKLLVLFTNFTVFLNDLNYIIFFIFTIFAIYLVDLYVRTIEFGVEIAIMAKP